MIIPQEFGPLKLVDQGYLFIYIIFFQKNEHE